MVNRFQVFSTRGSYSTVQTKAFPQLTRREAGLRVGEALLGYAKVVRVLLVMLHDKIPHVIRQRHAACLGGGRELRRYLFRHVECYGHALRLLENRHGCNADSEVEHRHPLTDGKLFQASRDLAAFGGDVIFCAVRCGADEVGFREGGEFWQWLRKRQVPIARGSPLPYRSPWLNIRPALGF